MNGKNVWIVSLPCNNNEDAKAFADDVSNLTRQGFEIESSGINTLPNGYSRVWAILTRPEKEEGDHGEAD